MTDAEALLEIHDRDGALVRTIGMTRDEQDTTKWRLATPLTLAGLAVVTAVM